MGRVLGTLCIVFGGWCLPAMIYYFDYQPSMSPWKAIYIFCMGMLSVFVLLRVGHALISWNFFPLTYRKLAGMADTPIIPGA